MICPGRRWTGRIKTVFASFLLASFMVAHLLDAAERAVPPPTARDECPVCGMFVAKHPDWVTCILFKDGSHLFFDGAKDMFKYLFEPERYDPANRKRDVAAVLVKEYYRLSWIDARKAWYVLGSDVFGPMGKELIALETEADAKEFTKDHKGRLIIRFSDVTPEAIKAFD